MKKLVLILLLVSITYPLTAQRFDFGRVSLSEIQQETHPIDTVAPASILYKKGKVSMKHNNRWQYVFEVEERVKIYKKEGFDYATITVPLYRAGAGKNEIFSNFKGYTHNLEGGKAVKERVTNAQIFDVDVNEFWGLKKITFPNVKEGSVIEYSYTVTSPYIQGLPEFYFQDQIPVDYAEYTMEIPEYLGYKTLIKEYIELKRESSTRLGGFNYSYIPTNLQRKSLGANQTHHDTRTIAFTTITYSAQNAPKVIQEDYMNSYKNYMTSIKPELEWEKYSQDATARKHSTSWEDIAKELSRSRSFGEELQKRNYFKDEFRLIIAGKDSQIEKATAIFDFVKNHMSWNNVYSIFSNDGLEKAFAKKTGNVAEVNLILTAMLKEANLDAYPVLLSSKSNGIPLYPTKTGFNYVICAVKVNNQLLLLDATERFTAPNILPERTLNWHGRLIKNKEENEQVNPFPNTPSRRVVNMEVNLNLNGSIQGKYRQLLTDHFALRYRSKYATMSNAIYLMELDRQIGDFEAFEFNIQNKTNSYEPLIESFTFTKQNAFDIIDSKLYINPLFFEKLNKNPFTAASREYPIDFSFSKSKTTFVTINLPENYSVEYLPESAVYQLPDDMGEFSFMITHTGNSVQLRVTKEIKIALMPAEYYEALKDYYKAIIAKQSQKIILKKDS